MMNLHSDHLVDLQLSGLTPDTIALMGVRSVVPQDVPGFENGKYAKVNTVLEIPYPGVEGFSRYKCFPPLTNADGKEQKYHQPPGTRSYLYILPPVTAKIMDASVPLIFVEGEKKAAAGVQHGLNAVGFSGVWNWKEKDTWSGSEELRMIPFACREVTIIPDSDVWYREDLQRPIYAFAKYLESRGASVKIWILPQPDKDKKVGLDDYLIDHSIDRLGNEKLITTRKLNYLKEWYDGWRAAKVKAEQEDKEAVAIVTDDEPSEDAVPGEKLIEWISEQIRRYVVLPPESAHTVALWIMHAWTINAWNISPYLFLTSPLPRCGKSTLLDVMHNLTPRSVLSSNFTPAVLYRVVDKHSPTLVIDEAEFLRNPETRGMVNAGHRRSGAFVWRCQGDNNDPVRFSVWAAKAVAAVGKMYHAFEDRSIIIHMRRATKTERKERYKEDAFALIAKAFRPVLARWALDNIDAARAIKVPVINELNDRAFDNWEPLLAIAAVIGGKWPEHAKKAALALSGNDTETEDSALVDLLTEFKTVFELRDRIWSARFIEHLTEDPNKRWADWNRGNPITPRQVAKLLAPLGIRPDSVRMEEDGKTKTMKGYLAEQFQDAFARYLSVQPQDPPFDPEQPEQANESDNLAQKKGPEQENPVPDKKNDLSSDNISDVPVVPDRNSENGGVHTNTDEDGFDWATGSQRDQRGTGGVVCGFPDRPSVQWMYIKRDYWIETHLRNRDGRHS